MPRRPLRLILIAAVFGLLTSALNRVGTIGVITGNPVLGILVAPLATVIGSGWGWGCFGAAFAFRQCSWRAAMTASVGSLLVAVVAYYLLDLGFGVYAGVADNRHEWMLAAWDAAVWGIVALVLGPLVGALGYLSRFMTWPGATARASLALGATANMGMLLRAELVIQPRLPVVVGFVVVGVAGLVIGAGVLVRQRRIKPGHHPHPVGE